MSAPQILQRRSNRGGRAVDIMMGAELSGEAILVRPASDCHDLEAHAPRELHGQMSEAPDADNGDEVAGACGRVAERAEGRQSRAEQRSSVFRGETIGDRHEAAGAREHVLRVAPIMMNAGELLVPAVDEIAAAALCTMSATAPEEADADTLPERPALDVIADRIDHAYRLMARHAAIGLGRLLRPSPRRSGRRRKPRREGGPAPGRDRQAAFASVRAVRPDGLDGGVCCRMVRHESSSV